MNPSRIVLLAALLAVLAPSTSAHAGTYTVRACADENGTTDSWSTSGGAIACPWRFGSAPGIGVAGNFATAFQSARASFSAPPGATVARMEGQVDITQSNGWQAGIYDYANSRWLYCGPGNPCNSFDNYIAFAFDNFRTPELGPFLICGQDQCNGTGKIYLRNVTTTIEDLTQPSLALGGPLASGRWLRGNQTITADANDNTGIRQTQLLIDGGRRAIDDRSCDKFRVVQCQNGAGDLGYQTSALSDGSHSATVIATDTAGNATTSSPVTVRTDNTAPDPITDLGIVGGDGWRSASKFDLSWVSPTQAAAPIDAAELELCPTGVKSGEEGCRRSARPAAEFVPAEAGGRSLLRGVDVPKVGEWTASLWLRDEAGNQSQQTARRVTLRFDPDPPTLAFRQLDPADPTRLRVAATDSTSGIVGAAIELQRRGEATWLNLDTQLEDGGFAASLDDVSLPDGAYMLRARAVDRASNERSTDRFDAGAVAEVSLPVRIKARLAVGKPSKTRIKRRGKGSKRRYRTTLLTRPKVGYGSRVRLQGQLTSPGGNPVSGTEVRVFAQTQAVGQAAQQIGTVTTSKTGRFSFRLPKGPSRVVSFRYPGTKTIRADAADVDLQVRASTTFRPSRRSVKNGETITFRGRLRGGWIPPEGKLVALQVRARGAWRPFATPRAGQDGRWRFQYRFDGTRGKVRYRFRARVLREATYPYSSGASGTRRVLVRGTRR